MAKIQEALDGLKTDWLQIKERNETFQWDFHQLLANSQGFISYQKFYENQIPPEFMAFLSVISNFDGDYDYKNFEPIEFKQELLVVSPGKKEKIVRRFGTIYREEEEYPQKSVIDYEYREEDFYVFKVLRNNYNSKAEMTEKLTTQKSENPDYYEQDAKLVTEHFSFWNFVTDEIEKVWEITGPLEKGLADAHKSAWDAKLKNMKIKPDEKWARALELIDKDKSLKDKSEIFVGALMQMRLDSEVIDYVRVNEILTALVNLNKVDDPEKLRMLKKVYLIIDRSILPRLYLDIYENSMDIYDNSKKNDLLSGLSEKPAEYFYLIKKKVPDHIKKKLTIIEKIHLFRVTIVWLQTAQPPHDQMEFQGGDKAAPATEQTQTFFGIKHFTRRN